MRTFVSALLAVVCLSVVATSANGRATYSEALTINEVGLRRTRVVLSRHNAYVYPPIYELSPDHRQLAYVPFTCDGCPPSDRLWIADVRRSRRPPSRSGTERDYGHRMDPARACDRAFRVLNLAGRG